MALTSLLRAQYSLFVLHASYLTFEIQLLSYGQFLAVAAYSDIGKACGETAKRVDGNCGGRGSDGNLGDSEASLTSACEHEGHDHQALSVADECSAAYPSARVDYTPFPESETPLPGLASAKSPAGTRWYAKLRDGTRLAYHISGIFI